MPRGDIPAARGHRTCPGSERQPRGGASHKPHTKGPSEGPSRPQLAMSELGGREDINREGEIPVLVPQMKPMWSAARQSPTASQGCVPTTQGQPPGPGMAQAIRRPSAYPGGMQTGVEMARLHLGGGNHNLGLGPFTPQPACALPNTHTHVREPELTKGQSWPADH